MITITITIPKTITIMITTPISIMTTISITISLLPRWVSLAMNDTNGVIIPHCLKFGNYVLVRLTFPSTKKNRLVGRSLGRWEHALVLSRCELLLRGTIIIRTCDQHKNLYNPLFLLVLISMYLVLGCLRFAKFCWVEKQINITMKPTTSPTQGQPNLSKLG